MEKKKYYKKIFNYFKEEKKNLFLYSITSLIAIGTSTLSPAISAKSLSAITNVELDKMIFWAFLLLILSSLDIMINYISEKSSRDIQNNVSLKIKKDVSSELFNLEMKNFDKEGTGFFVNRIENEPRALAGIFTRIRYHGYFFICGSFNIYIHCVPSNWNISSTFFDIKFL